MHMIDESSSNMGHIYFISGPSGVGKGTVIDALKHKYPDWVFPPSCTTRAPRPGEVEGQTYCYLTREAFQAQIEAGAFLEYAEVHGGNLYGTVKEWLVKPAHEGKTVVREFDVQGYMQARERLPRELFTSIFIVPGDDEATLRKRILDRAPISDEDLNRRMESLEKELQHAHAYDHIVTSHHGQIDQMVQDFEAIML